LGLWLDSDLPDLEVEQIRALAGVSQRSAYKYRKGDLYKNLWEHIARKYNQLSDAYGGATGISKSTTTPSKLNKRPSIREKFYEESPSELVEIQELLSAHAQGSSKEDLLMRSGYSEAFVDALLDIAGKAAELTVVKPPQDRTAERTVVQDLPQDRAAPYVHSFRNSAPEKRSVCPLRALRAWLDASKISSGPVLRAVDQKGQVSPSGLHRDSIGYIIKRAAARAGMNVANIAGHSLRSGGITTAAENGVPEYVIRRQSHHNAASKSFHRYIRLAERFSKNESSGLGL